MNDILKAGRGCDDMHYSFLRAQYESLPAAIKSLYTPKEWLWLGEERDRVIERETMPDGPPE